MADIYGDNGQFPEGGQPDDGNAGKDAYVSSAKTGHTSRFAYTDKHMPGGHYQSPDEDAYASSANGKTQYYGNARQGQRRTGNTGRLPNMNGQASANAGRVSGPDQGYAGNGAPYPGGNRNYSDTQYAGDYRNPYDQGSRSPRQGGPGQDMYSRMAQNASAQGGYSRSAQGSQGQAYYHRAPQGASGQGNYNRPAQGAPGQGNYYRPAQGASGQGNYNRQTQGAPGQGNYNRSGQGVSGQNGYNRSAQGTSGQGNYNRQTQGAYSYQGQGASGSPNYHRTSQGAYAGYDRSASGTQPQGGYNRPAQGNYNRSPQGAYAGQEQGGNPQRSYGAQTPGNGHEAYYEGSGAVSSNTRRGQGGSGGQGEYRTAAAGAAAGAYRQGGSGKHTEGQRVANGQIRVESPPGSRNTTTKTAAPVKSAGSPVKSAGSKKKEGGTRSTEKGPKKKSIGMIILMVFLLLILGVLVFGVAFIFGKLNLMGRDLKVSAIRDVDDVYVDEHVKADTSAAGYTNIMLVGIDSRDSDVIDYANSDTMIICSINNETGKVRLVSLYRDTYLNIMSPENVNKNQYNKANSAYNLGSAPQMLSMVNANLDLNIKDYAVVDFKAVIKLVDAVDGIDITLTDQEAIHLNNYQEETAEITGQKAVPLEVYVGQGTHDYHLNGIQATAYCRIRYTEGWDMKRTQRQRLVIEKIIQKVKAGGLGMANRVLDEVLPLCYTSLDTGEIFNMATKMFNFEIEKTTGFPSVHLGKDVSSTVMSAVIPVTLEDNVVVLHKWLYDQETYDTSQTVKDFSRQIILNTGYGPEKKQEAIADSMVGNSGGEADSVL